MVRVSMGLNVVKWSLEYNYVKREAPVIVTQCHRDLVLYPPASADIYIENSLPTTRELSSVVTSGRSLKSETR